MKGEIGIEQRAYVPGLAFPKFLSVLAGVVVLAVGLLWAWHPAWLFFRGNAATADVVFVEMTRPGQEPIRLTSGKEVREAEDPTRTATFSYHVQFPGAAGKLAQGTLNYGHAMRPQHHIGEVLNIRYDAENPADLVVIDSISTWSFSIFFSAAGLLIVISQTVLLINANRPIRLDSIEGVVAHPEQSAGYRA